MFERFTDSARLAVSAAQVEARATGARFIGTEHLLIALLANDRGPAYRLLTGAGLTADRVRAEVARLAPPHSEPLGEADAEALRAIGIDLGAVIARVEETFGAGALQPPDEPAEKRRGLFGRGRRGPAGGTTGHPVSDHIRFSPRAKKSLELSLREALHRKDDHIGAEHILLGVLREGDGLAAKILTGAGLSLADLRTRLHTELGNAA